jgi:hypothetical protein
LVVRGEGDAEELAVGGVDGGGERDTGGERGVGIEAEGEEEDGHQ